MTTTSEERERIHDHRIHPAASVFPLLEGDQFQSLVESIAVHGVQNPIVSYEGEVLDGRNRLRAVMKLRDEGHKVEMPYVEWDDNCGMAATEWVAAQNLNRRHLSADAYAAATAAINRILRIEAKDRKKAGQAKAGQASKNLSGRRGKKTGSEQTVRASSRDHKAEDARSTAGQVAAKAGVSLRKAKQAIALDKAVESGAVSSDVQKEVIAGKKKLKDVVPKKLGDGGKAKAETRTGDVEQEIRTASLKAWQRLKDRFPPNEHPMLRKIFTEIILDK